MPERRAPWVVVNGGLHRHGGMDRANAALVDFLLARGDLVHVVAHHVDGAYRGVERLTLHEVPRPLGSVLLGELPLERRALAVAASLPGARLVANGGNCRSPDVNWVHSVHAAWPCVDPEAPLWFRAKNRAMKGYARVRERAALGAARLVVANSERTARDLRERVGVAPARIAVVPLGADEDAAPVPSEARVAARATLGIAPREPVVAFVGALSHDDNKGFDVLLAAWAELARAGVRPPLLVAAGGGSGVPRWRAAAARLGLEERVRLLGFTDKVPQLLAATDLLASPVRYEAFGLNVLEAITRDIPVLVSRQAGVVERLPDAAREMVLEHPQDPRALAARVQEWLARRDEWRAAAQVAGRELRAWRWSDMARAMAAVMDAAADGAAARGPARTPAGAALP